MSRATLTEESIHLAPATYPAPSVTGDLMIAGELESLKVRNEHRPGEKCFLWEGNRKWLPSERVKNFIREYGADDPTDFAAIHGMDWKHFLFGNLKVK